MATEILNVNGWDSGWPTGFVGNIDEPVASADGSSVSTTALSDVVTLAFDNSAITDIDVVTGIDFTVRAYSAAILTYTPGLSFELLIDGSPVSGTDTAVLTNSWANYTVSNVNWDQDWTQAQLNSIQLRVTTTGTPDASHEFFIDCVDCVVTYQAPIEEPVPEETLALAGQQPTIEVTKTEPPKLDVSLAGKAPTLDYGIAVDAGVLALTGNQSWPNPLTLQLQPNGWDAGWPNGFLSNIDEPTSAADGSTIDTDADADAVVLSLDDVGSTILDAYDVLNVTMVLRGEKSRSNMVAQFDVELLINGASQGTSSAVLNAAMTNHSLSNPGWDQDWTQAQLNSMQVRVTSAVTSGPSKYNLYLDALDVIVTYAEQSPLERRSDSDALALTGYAPTVKYDEYVTPAADTLVLSGKVPGYFRGDTIQVFTTQKLINEKTPKRIVDFIELPGSDNLVISGKVPVKTVADSVAPSAETLALSGKVPVSLPTDNRSRIVPRRQLSLSGEAPVIPQSTNEQIITPRIARVLSGKTPTASRTVNRWAYPARDTLVLTGKAPTMVRGRVISPAVDALVLSGQVPASVISTVISPSAETLVFTTYAPPVSPAVDALILTTAAPITAMGYIVAQGSLTLAGYQATTRNASVAPDVYELSLTGQDGPVLTFTTALTPGNHGLLSFSSEYDIEFIASPTDILIT